MVVTAAPGPAVRDAEVVFAYPDPRRELRGVRLVHELFRPRVGPPFTRERGSRTWLLRLPRPPVDRIEYQLQLTRTNGDIELVCDPGNPLRAGGPFGDKSVVELPGYRPPAWLDADAPAGRTAETEVWSRALRATFRVVLWSSAGARAGRPLPLLVVHDGPEYAAHSSLLGLLDAAVASGRVRPMRAALVAPVHRDDNYSASAAYARTLSNDVLPAVLEVAPARPRRRWRVGMGASLGALAMLHAHRTHPDLFGGLFLQSGSFFRGRWDPHEAGFPRFARITRFVEGVLEGKQADPIEVAVTCGIVEENLGNNVAVAAALSAQGYGVRLHETRDAHNWVAWRDAADAHLIGLLRRLWP